MRSLIDASIKVESLRRDLEGMSEINQGIKGMIEVALEMVHDARQQDEHHSQE